MIFKQWKQVLDGTKTQTRRPVKEHEEANRWDVETDVINEVIATYPKGKWGSWQSVYVVGKTYAVQPPGKKAVGRIRITKIRREKLQNIDINGVLAEGISLEEIQTWLNKDHPESFMHYSPAQRAFQCLWDSIHGKGAWERMKDDDVWVLDFWLINE